MKKTLIFFVLLSLFWNGNAQDTNKQEFIGALTTTSNTIISYKLYLTVRGDGNIEGISVTDFYGSDITESKIEGHISNKKISFVEKENISTKSTEDETSFCYVSANDLKIRTVQDKQIIQGEFVGNYSSGKECARGVIYMVSSNVLEEVRSIVDSLSFGADTLIKLHSLLNAAESHENDVRKYTSNDALETEWQSNEIVFNVWDGYSEDNDMISIYANNRLIEKNLIIKNEKKTIRFAFEGERMIVRIVAISEGSSPRNTVNFILQDGETQNPFILSLNKGEEFSIEFKKKQ